MAQSVMTGAELIVETGLLAGTRFLLDRPLVSIGRAEDNDVTLEDAMVSKNHCRIITQGDNYLVEDLGSSNGTIVNGQQVNTYMLQDGDKLFLGDTTLTFRKAAGAAVATAPMAATQAAVVSPEGKSKKWIWVTAGIIGGLVLVATAIVLVLVFVVLPERDPVAPTVSFASPTANQTFQINMPVPNGVDITVEVSASDNKGLDRVELLADNNTQPLKVFKATTSRKESQGAIPKTEKFSTTWKANAVGGHTFKVKAYDWKGNVSTTEELPVKVDLSGTVNNAHAYCQQIDRMVGEYNVAKTRFGQAYSGAPAGRMSWIEAYGVFDAVESERQSLLSQLKSMSPPAEFAESHSAFERTVECALKADGFAKQWATEMNYITMYPGYTNTYALSYKSGVDDWSGQAQAAANTFNNVYTAARQGQLGIGPGAHLQ